MHGDPSDVQVFDSPAGPKVHIAFASRVPICHAMSTVHIAFASRIPIYHVMSTAHIIGLQVSIVVGKQTLYLVNINDPESPLELAFQAKYGNIVSYRWYALYF